MHIAIAGNIGSGKTTLSEKLARHYQWEARLEDVDDNPYLVDFYDDMKKWSFHLQVYFLNSRFKQIKDLRESPRTIIQDRTIYEDAYIFARNLRQSNLIDERDYQNYLKLFESMVSMVQAPDLLIYLKADIPKLVSQIQKRGRDYEDNIRLDYLKNLNRHYEDWIGSYTHGKLLVIDCNEIDFVKHVEHFAGIVSKIDVELNGLFSDPSLRIG